MFNIGGLFQKFLALQAKEIGVRNIVIESIQKNIGVTLVVGDIEINNSIIFIKKLPQAAKNSLFMKKDIILDEINTKQVLKKISSIKY